VAEAPEPVVPAYGGACVEGLVPALLDRFERAPPSWIPEPVARAEQVVLFVVDGLGWEQLGEREAQAPTLAGMAGGPITSVAPTTTATALTSITTGLTPAAHGVLGYRVRVETGEIMNVLQWRTASGDARSKVPPGVFQSVPAFTGRPVPVVTRSEFASTGFTLAHLKGARLHGWRMPSSLVQEVADLLKSGEPFVYAYYDGIDKVAHEFGIGDYYDAELGATDRLVDDLLSVLPAGAALAVSSDHGQVHVGTGGLFLDDDVIEDVAVQSGEGRFRWLHARPGSADRLAQVARDRYGDVAWVLSRDEVVAAGWFGGPLPPAVEDRVGDVALVPFAPVAFLDGAESGEANMVGRHGSLTPAEMWVPVLAGRA
jgi:predicted AlkP superfamily pyrophosphatase or phosphodiesterase